MTIKVHESIALNVKIMDDNGDINELIRFSPGNWFIKIDGSYDPMSATDHLEEQLQEELKDHEWITWKES